MINAEELHGSAESVWMGETSPGRSYRRLIKTVVGNELRAHADKREATKVAVAVHVLNRMSELGRPGCLTSHGSGASPLAPLTPASR